MSDTHELPLPGCTPEPLMSYLKSLGILRVVSEQADPDAAACWQSGQFVLFSKFDKDKLVNFFLTNYKPTPILAPWNAGCGFYKKWDPAFPDSKKRREPGYEFYRVWEPKDGCFKSRKAVDALEAIEHSTIPALESYRTAIQATRKALASCAELIDVCDDLASIKTEGQRKGWAERETRNAIKEYLNAVWLFDTPKSQAKIDSAQKDEFVRLMRSSVLDDQALRWLDAALVLVTGQKKNRIEAPLLGKGGNIGNSEISARFMQLLTRVLPSKKGQMTPKNSRQLLRASLLGHSIAGLLEFAVDQFDPGMAGGANMGQGMEASYSLNPWDYILMVEGAVLLAGTTARRLEASRVGSAFPFSVDSVPVGFASAGEDDTSGELWLPVWNRPCSYTELSALLAEGRAEIGGHRPRNAVEFARAVAALGVDRGIDEFVRLQFQKRFGDNFLATVLATFDVRYQADVRLLDELDRWLSDYRYACSGEKPKTAPRFTRSLRQIESAIFDYCRHGRRQEMQAILVALGRTERELALRTGQIKKDKLCPPLSRLSTNWFKATHDGSLEFDIALALAGIYDGTREAKRNIGPIRCNLEAIAVRYGRAIWITDDKQQDRDEQSKHHVVWNSADLPTNMAAVLGRRMMDGARAGCEGLPLAFRRGISLDTIAAFIAGEVDDSRIEDLLWGFMLIKHGRSSVKLPPMPTADAPPLPRKYALLKLLFLPRPLVGEWNEEFGRWTWRFARVIEAPDGNKKLEDGIRIRPEPRVLPLLRGGRLGEASRIAYQRLSSSGLKPLPHPMSGSGSRDDEWKEERSEAVRLKYAHRLAAALLLPIGDHVVNELIHLVTRQDQETETETLATEGATES